MVKTRQFSLAYLLLEVACIALSLGFTCQAFRTSDDYAVLRAVLICAAVIAWATSIGGLFRRMGLGMLLGGYVVVAMLILSSIPGGIF